MRERTLTQAQAQLAKDIDKYTADMKQLAIDQQDVYDREQALSQAA